MLACRLASSATSPRDAETATTIIEPQTGWLKMRAIQLGNAKRPVGAAQHRAAVQRVKSVLQEVESVVPRAAVANSLPAAPAQSHGWRSERLGHFRGLLQCLQKRLLHIRLTK